MIISHRLKYVFVHIPKTGGTSIRNLITNNYQLFKPDVTGSWYGITEEHYAKFPNVTRELWTHSTAEEIKNWMTDNNYDWDDYFKFCFIRNPWDRMVSAYEYHIQQSFTDENNLSLKKIYKQHPHEVYISEQCKTDPLIKMACDQDKNLLVDFIGKLEKIESHMKQIVQKINPDLKETDWKLKKENTTKRREYKSYYTEKTIEAVRKHQQKTIQFGGYEF